MQLLSVPYPRPSLSEYAKVTTGIGVAVAFILIVFQPFGTDDFVHQYKYAILAGYGLVIILASLLTYLVVGSLSSDQFKDSWSVVHETVALFISVLSSIVVCYLYQRWIFGGDVTMRGLSHFLLYGGSVALLPVLVYFAFIYLRYRDVRRSVLGSADESQPSHILLKGKNKGDSIELSQEDLLFLRSSDNYVMVHFLSDGLRKKRLLRSTLSEISNQLTEDFVKVHRSYIINRHKVIDIEGNVTNTRLTLSEISDKIPVSRAHVDKVRNMV